ncbi:MAG: glycosyltransferase family 2 protein [Nitrospinota bacterium]|nr:glycosyltransferase family 2 protein [Nitrospinota bacterium]
MTDLTTSPVELSVIIVTCNSSDYVRNCLQSVQRAVEKIDHELIVVDNASQDGTQEIIRNEFSNIRLIVNQENLGYARGNNQAIAISRGQYLWLLNPDTMVPPQTPSILLREMKRSPRIGLMGCRLLNADQSIQLSFGFEISLFNEAVRKLFFNLWENYRFPPAGWLVRSMHARYREVDWVKGASMVAVRQAIFDAELMDERFFLYLEDADLSLRLRQLGWKVVYTPDTEIIHFGSGSVRSNPDRSELEHRISQLNYFKKHLGPGRLKILKIYLALKLRKNLALITVRKWVGWGSRERLAARQRSLQETLSLVRNF